MADNLIDSLKSISKSMWFQLWCKQPIQLVTCISHVTICDSLGKAYSSQEFEDSFYLQLKVLWCEMRLSGSSFYQRTALVSWHLSHLSGSRNRWSLYPFDKNKSSGHVVSCFYTIHNVLRLYWKSLFRKYFKHFCFLYRLIIKFWDEYFGRLSRVVVVMDRGSWVQITDFLLSVCHVRQVVEIVDSYPCDHCYVCLIISLINFLPVWTTREIILLKMLSIRTFW